MSKMNVEAKKSVLQRLKKDMRDMMHGGLPEKLKGKVKKVVVEADSEEGLEKGLSTAQKILKGKLESKELEDMDEESEESEKEHDEEDFACGGSKKYMDGGVEEAPEEKEEEEESSLKKYFRGFQGTRPFAKK